MDNLTQILSSLAPGQIEEAVQLLQRYKTQQQQQQQEQSFCSEEANRGASNVTVTAVSAAIATASHRMPAEEGNEEDASDDEEDVPLVELYLRRKQQEDEEQNTNEESENDKVVTIDQATPMTMDGKPTSRVSQGETTSFISQRTPTRRRGSKGENNHHNHSETNDPNTSTTATGAPRGLASFGFVSAARRAEDPCDKNKLFTPFVQDKRIVPPALCFWQKTTPTPTAVVPTPPPSPSPPPCEASILVVDENSSLMHPPLGRGESVRETLPPEPPRFTSFEAMLDAATHAAMQTGEATPPMRCACPFHVSLPPPRVGFRDEVIFCGFFAVGYDPCQSRPPYFGTYNSQDAINAEELFRLARFPAGASPPRMAALDYEYDSGDDWDVVDGDEELGASSSDEDDEEDADADADSLAGSDLDFINDDPDGDEDGEDAELQRRMMEARQRRMQQLRQKDKLVPAFSGPFVGVPMADHPLRAFDVLERFATALDDQALSAMLEHELRTSGAMSISAANGTQEEDAEAQQRRLVEAALRNRRDMAPEEVDAVHALVAANSKISPRAILETLLQQQLCVGVARAEVLRTIRRFYERRHNILVRREVPWAATDERLFKSNPKEKSHTKPHEKGEAEEVEAGEGQKVSPTQKGAKQLQLNLQARKPKPHDEDLVKLSGGNGSGALRCDLAMGTSTSGDAASAGGNAIGGGRDGNDHFNEDEDEDVEEGEEEEEEETLVVELFRKRNRGADAPKENNMAVGTNH